MSELLGIVVKCEICKKDVTISMESLMKITPHGDDFAYKQSKRGDRVIAEDVGCSFICAICGTPHKVPLILKTVFHDEPESIYPDDPPPSRSMVKLSVLLEIGGVEETGHKEGEGREPK